MTTPSKPPLGAPPVIRENVFYWAARAAISLNFILGDSHMRKAAFAKIETEFHKTPIWTMGNTSILNAAVMLSPTAIAYQTVHDQPIVRITAKEEIAAFENAYLHPFLLMPLFGDLFGDLSGGLKDPTSIFAHKASTKPHTEGEEEPPTEGEEELDASAFEPLPSENLDTIAHINACASAHPSMKEVFPPAQSIHGADGIFETSPPITEILASLAVGFDFLSITLAHDPNAYLNLLGVQGPIAQCIDQNNSPFAHISYEIRIFRGRLAIIRVFDATIHPAHHIDEYILTLGNSPLIEIRQMNSEVRSSRLYLACFRLFFDNGVVTVQLDNGKYRHLLARIWPEGEDLRVRYRTASLTRELSITGRIIGAIMEDVMAATASDSLKIMGVLPDLIGLGVWIFRTTEHIPRARLLLDIDASLSKDLNNRTHRPKAKFRPDGPDTITRILEFQSDMFFDQMAWPVVLSHDLLQSLKFSVFVPPTWEAKQISEVRDISDMYADHLNMGNQRDLLFNALSIIPAAGKWRNPILVPKATSNTFAAIASILHITIPIAHTRLRFDYAAAVSKFWALLHTPNQFEELGWDRLDASFGEPVYLSLANLGLKDLPPDLAELDTLEEIDLSHNRLKHLPAWLAAMPRLRRLNLTGNRIKSLAPLYNSPWIQDIICDGNPLADFTATTATTEGAESTEKGKAKSDLPVD